MPNITYASNIYDTANKADLLIILTEWNEFREINFDELKLRMNTPNIIDARNLYDPERIRKYGFNYMGVGR